MTVAEMITALQHFDPTAQVLVYDAYQVHYGAPDWVELKRVRPAVGWGDAFVEADDGDAGGFAVVAIT